MTKKCSKCNLEKDLSEFNSREGVKDGKRPECKVCGKKIRDFYYKKPEIKTQVKIYMCDYNKINSNKIKFRRNKWFKEKTQTDILFRLKRNLRTRIYKFIGKSSIRTKDIVGINSKQLKDYLENQFKDEMCWENYGEWHIDHIIPLSSAKTEEEIYKLCYYTNLQPLWKIDNIKKSNKIIW
jgi:5-methylcytosine-specific restriction endonuclease McrA